MNQDYLTTLQKTCIADLTESQLLISDALEKHIQYANLTQELFNTAWAGRVLIWKLIMSDTLFLSRKNLQTLLSKLDRQLEGQETECTIIKFRSLSDKYQQTMSTCVVTAVENKDYYEGLERPAGIMHPADEVRIHSDASSY